MMRFLLGTKSIGFLTLHEIEKAGYLGSFLITDFKGIPMEFRCTHSLKPDAIQRSLYGEALLSYIGVEICGRPLIRSTKNKPKLIFVDKPFLLKLDDHASCPIVLVREIDREEEHTISANFGLEYQIEVIEPRYKGFKPLEIVKKGEMKTKTKELVERLYSEFNILESFERMRKAVESLNQLNRFK